VRTDQAATTRAAVITSARELFLDAGWAGTTIAGIARAAKVSPETIYAVFGSKALVFAEVVRTGVRRGDPATPLTEQAGPQAVAAAPNQITVLDLFTRDLADVLTNVAGLMAIARGVATSEPDIGEIYRGIHRGRRDNFGLVAKALRRHGPLRHGMSEADAVTIIWRLASPELFLLMTEIEALSPIDYADWLKRTLGALLLPEGDRRTNRDAMGDRPADRPSRGG
jgi:AcrR family transcriptional regulator